MNKTEEFYKEILKRKVVNVEDLKEISKMLFEADDDYYYRKYIQKVLKEGKVGKIRKGLYYGVPLDKLEDYFEVDRYITGDKIKKGNALAYHTALELHGAAHSAHGRVFVLVTKKDRFRKFNFQDVEYVPVVNKHDIGHITRIEYENTSLSVTDPARNFVDSLSRPDLCGGWEECLKSLANLKGLSLSEVKEVISAYDNKTLELKCGYVLELLSKNSPYYDHIQIEDLHPLKPPQEWKPVYIDRDVPSELKEDWGLYIPEGLEDLLRGV
ncbi:MAG: type IV toxin-antitoxin system AbiEi family antitoxin domain-containing protein [Thermoplasmatota archaeon]